MQTLPTRTLSHLNTKEGVRAWDELTPFSGMPTTLKKSPTSPARSMYATREPFRIAPDSLGLSHSSRQEYTFRSPPECVTWVTDGKSRRKVGLTRPKFDESWVFFAVEREAMFKRLSHSGQSGDLRIVVRVDPALLPPAWIVRKSSDHHKESFGPWTDRRVSHTLGNPHRNCRSGGSSRLEKSHGRQSIFFFFQRLWRRIRVHHCRNGKFWN